MSAPIEMSNGRDTVKIYTLTSRGRPMFQLAFYRAGLRERRTFSDKARAKREAKTILCQLAAETAATDKAITTTDIESLVAARAALGGIALPLHLAIESFAGAVRQLGMPADPVLTLHRAVAFYIQHHPIGSVRLPISEMLRLYLESRKRRHLSAGWIGSVGTVMRAVLKWVPAEQCDLPSGQKTVAWLEEKYQSPITKNSVLKTLKAFASWAMKEKLIFAETITYVESWKEPPVDIEIYTPEELQRILDGIPACGIPTFVIGAFAGLRAAEALRLDWSEVNLERGFITVAASKAKTAARRLVPISENLKAWLEPHVRTAGEIAPFSSGYLNKIIRDKNLPHKRNALRHSYISYRLALIADTPRVALECGNSPMMIFQHYRELVAPEDAKAWFAIMPKKSNELLPITPL